MKIKYKFLNLKRGKIVSNHGSMEWAVNKWQHVDGRIIACKNGLHCSDTILEALGYVQGEVLALVETKGKKHVEGDKSAWSDMKIVKAFEWTKKDSVALSIFASELCLKEFEELYPDDKRPRDAIEAAKKVLKSDTAKNRAAARSATESARLAWSAAESAAWSARSAAWSAESAESAELAARKRTLNKINKWILEHTKEMKELK